MAATIFVPTPLRKVTGGQAKIQIDAATLEQVIERADALYPGFAERIIDTNGEIKRFINVFVNGVDVRKLQGRATPVRDGDEVAVIPAMAGGESSSADSQILVSADWLKAHLNDPKVRTLDARVADPRLPMGYRAGHIPGAVPFDLNRDVYDRSRGYLQLKSAEALAETLGSRGVSNDATIVVYDESTGPLAASIYWLLRYIGHRDVRVLDGGWEAWKQADGPITRDAPAAQPMTYTAQPDESQYGTADWIQANTPRDDVVLLDTRTDAEYYMGHIPGAVNLAFEEALDYRTQSLKPADELKRHFEAAGVTPDKEIVTYCGSGSRSAHTYMVLKALGYPRVRNYNGSMMDWAQVRRLPVE